MFNLTAFQRDLLYTIAGLNESHGLGIKQEMENAYNQDVNHGRLYPNLDTLIDKGLVEKGEIDKRTNSYSLTPRGQRAIEARQEWVSEKIE